MPTRSSSARRGITERRSAGFGGDRNSGDRAEVLEDFENGRYDVLCNSMLLTEGWDCPAVDCVVILRPTKIRSLYQQMVGRGMRLSPGKADLLLLDFLWMTARHDLCRPSALISKDETIAKKIKSLRAEYGALIEKKKSSYSEFQKRREEMKEIMAAKANVDRILGMDERTERTAQREKQTEVR